MADNINNTLTSIKEQHSLIASRTQLRRTLKVLSSNSTTENHKHRQLIHKIATDASKSTHSLIGLVINNASKEVWFNNIPKQLPVWANYAIPNGELGFRVYSLSEKEHLIAFRSPLVLDGEYVGLLTSFFNHDQIYNSINEAKESHKSLDIKMKYQINNRMLDLMPTQNSSMSNELYLRTKVKKLLFNDNDTLFEFENAINEKYILTATPLSIKNAALVLEIRHKVVYSLLRQTFTYLILSMLVLLISMIFASYFVSTFLTVPLKKLVNTTESIIKGDYKVRANEKLEGEFGHLSRTYNVMLNTITSALYRANM